MGYCTCSCGYCPALCLNGCVPLGKSCGCYVIRTTTVRAVADLVKLDSLLDSGHSWTFQRGLLAGNAAEACQTCALIRQ